MSAYRYYKYTANGSAMAPPQLPGLADALEIGGES
jgi:hypothetical protein